MSKAGLLCCMSLMFAIIFVLAPKHSFAAAAADLGNVDINGFRLGMTIDEVKKTNPDMVVKEIKPDGKILIGYKAHIGEIALYFTSAELGHYLFNIQKIRIYPAKQNAYPIFRQYIKKYGKPDYSGRQMFHIQACWGRCFGNNRKLEFRMKISSATNQSYPMTLTLSDPKIERENRSLFLKKKEERD